MSNKNYDSEFCGKLPLHQINAIQSYGYLLVLDATSFRIVQASENISSVFNTPVQELVGLSIDNFIKPEEFNVLKAKFKNGISDKIPLTFTLANKSGSSFTALVQLKENCLIVELQHPGERNTFIDVFQDLKFVMAEINMADSVESAAQVVVNALRQIAGFDRVLMYQFDEKWNGTVIAEDKVAEMESYLALKFPASDIPKQARDLYQRNAYRLIPERDYTPVKLFPVINPQTNSFINLSDCNLRSVAGVHLEYMKNMGIKASMSIRVMKDDKLWGLISCHHREPINLSYETCSVFELLSAVISSAIASLLNKEHFERHTRLQEKRNNIIDQIYSSGGLIDNLLNENQLILDLFNAGGAVISFRGRLDKVGQVPPDEEISDLIYWLQSKSKGKIFAEESISSAFENGSRYAENASGILAIPINPERGEFLVLFRPEVVQTLKWGGNPDEAINFESDGKKYHPRNSFKVWQETVEKTSLPWQQDELSIAEGLRSFIFEYSSRQLEA